GGPDDTYPAVRAWLAEMLPVFAATQHLMGNLAVALDGDTASGRCMCFNPMALRPTTEKDQQVFFYGLWYVLEFVRTADGWRITTTCPERRPGVWSPRGSRGAGLGWGVGGGSPGCGGSPGGGGCR